MILSDVEETVHTIEIDEETEEEHNTVSMPFAPYSTKKRTSIAFCKYSQLHHSVVPTAFALYCLLTLVLQQTKRNIPMLFVRGDGVILVSPPMRTS